MPETLFYPVAFCNALWRLVRVNWIRETNRTACIVLPCENSVVFNSCGWTGIWMLLRNIPESVPCSSRWMKLPRRNGKNFFFDSGCLAKWRKVPPVVSWGISMKYVCSITPDCHRSLQCLCRFVYHKPRRYWIAGEKATRKKRMFPPNNSACT